MQHNRRSSWFKASVIRGIACQRCGRVVLTELAQGATLGSGLFPFELLCGDKLKMRLAASLVRWLISSEARNHLRFEQPVIS